jgi:transposase InsO family protein
MYQGVKRHVQVCRECQLFSDRRLEEELHPTWGTGVLWAWVTVDVVYMPTGRGGKKYLVVARDYTSGWPEAKGLTENSSAAVARFLDEYIFARWGLPYRLSVDGGPENRGLVIDLAKQYGITRVVSSAYHPQGQGLIERGHKELVGALQKMKGNWADNLHRALWADRISVKRSTGETPAYLVLGQEHVLPIELSIPTWQTIQWGKITDTESLIAARAKQFERRDHRLEESVDRTVRLRYEGKEWFDNRHVLRGIPL